MDSPPTRHSVSFLLALLSLSAALPLAAQLHPLGVEQRIDTGTGIGVGVCPAAAALADGSFLVAWSPPQEESLFHCDPGGLVYARHLSADLEPQGRPRVLQRTGSVCIVDLQLGRLQDGRVAATWRQDPGSLSGLRVFGRTLAEGGRVAGRFFVDADRAIPLRSGDFLALFRTGEPQRPGVEGQRFDTTGQPRGARFALVRGGDPSANLNIAGAAELDDGRLVFVWQPFGSDGFGRGVRGRLFGADGRPQGPAFVVTDNPNAGWPLVASGPDGRFAIVWSAGKGQSDVFARLYSGDAVADTGQVAVNVSPAGDQFGAAVDFDAEGQVVVVWLSHRDANGDDVVARVLAEDGSTRGPALSVQGRKAGDQGCARLIDAGAGRWLAVWSGDGPEGKGVYARLLAEE